MSKRTVQYRDLFDIFLREQRSIMFRAFLFAATPFECEQCGASFEMQESGVEEEDLVLCWDCGAKEPSGRR